MMGANKNYRQRTLNGVQNSRAIPILRVQPRQFGLNSADRGRAACAPARERGNTMLIYRGKLVSGPAALHRLVLRKLIYETVLVGPVVPSFHGDVARLVELPARAGLRIDYWKRGTGWTEAPKGAFGLDEFMPGACRPAAAKDAARLDIPASELDDITAEDIAIAKHEMSRPRILRGFLYGAELPNHAARRDRARIVNALKNRAWDLAARAVTPGHG
jgi:hypothetical protein